MRFVVFDSGGRDQRSELFVFGFWPVTSERHCIKELRRDSEPVSHTNLLNKGCVKSGIMSSENIITDECEEGRESLVDFRAADKHVISNMVYGCRCIRNVALRVNKCLIFGGDLTVLDSNSTDFNNHVAAGIEACCFEIESDESLLGNRSEGGDTKKRRIRFGFVLFKTILFGAGTFSYCGERFGLLLVSLLRTHCFTRRFSHRLKREL